MIFSCHQQSEEELSKRLLYVKAPKNTTPDPAPVPPADEPKDAAFKSEAQRLDAEKIETDAGDDLSVGQIIQRLQSLRDLRRSGQQGELNQKAIEWYGSHPVYGPQIIAAGNRATPTILGNIRTGELARVRTLCTAQGQSEFDSITGAAAPPTYAAAYAGLTTMGGMLPNRLGQSTRDLLTDMNLNTPNNSAIEYLNTFRQKERLEQQLKARKSNLHRLEANLQRNKVGAQQRLDRIAETWKENRWSWMKPLASFVGKAFGLGVAATSAIGLGTGFWKAEGVGDVLSGLWGADGGVGMSTLLKPLACLATFKGAAVMTGVGVAAGIYHNWYRVQQKVESVQSDWQQARLQQAIDAEKRRLNLEELETQVKQAEATLEGYRKENADRIEQLTAQQAKIRNALADTNITDVQETRLNTAIDQLQTLITLYSISEGDYAAQITAPGPVTNPYIVQNLQALGVGDDSDLFPPLLELADRQDTANTRTLQRTIKEIAMEGTVEKEIPQLSRTQRNRADAFFQTPTNANATTALDAAFNRKAPRLSTVIRSLDGLNDDNVWKTRMCQAFRRSLEQNDISTAQASLLAMLVDMEKENPKAAKAIRRQPRVLSLWAQGPGGFAANQVPNARRSEKFEEWSSRLTPAQSGFVLDALQRAQGLSLNNAGALVDRLGPVRATITASFGALTPNVRAQLHASPNENLAKASKAIRGRKGGNFKLAEGIGFMPAINEVSDGSTLQDIRQLLQDMVRTAYVTAPPNVELMFVTDDKLTESLNKMKDETLKTAIRNDVNTLLNVTPAGWAGGAPPANTGFAQWLQLATVDQRVLLADKMRNAELWQMREDIKAAYGALSATAQNELNSANIGTVRTALRDAASVMRIRKNYDAIPAAGAGPNFFEERVDAITNYRQAKDLLDLLTSGVNHTGGVWVRP